VKSTEKIALGWVLATVLLLYYENAVDNTNTTTSTNTSTVDHKNQPGAAHYCGTKYKTIQLK